MIEEISRLFMTESEEKFTKFIESNNPLVILKNLLRTYVNDKNSSFLREMVTCSVAGYSHSTAKLGYDGSFGEIPCEVKPQNVIIDSNNRLNMGGNFTDFTWRKFKKCQEDELRMLMSGFVEGKLVYILEFPFNNDKFKSHLLSKLNKFLPNGDEKNRYIRSCSWSFIHVDGIIIRYLSKDFRNYDKKITKNLFKFLEEGEFDFAGPVDKGK